MIHDEKTIGRGTWIDKLAHELLEREKSLGRSLDMIRVESGLGASGIPHIGSLGDAVRAYGVKLALEDAGYRSELVAYSDDMDGLRKVPEGFPESLGEHIAKPVSAIPDPSGRHESYGARMSSLLLEGLDDLGVRYDFRRASDTYRTGALEEQIHAILGSSERIGARIADMVGQEKFRSSLPYFPVCASCGRLYTARATEYVPDERRVVYRCEGARIGDSTVDGCGHEGESDIRTGEGKLAWKVEFAARWQAFDIRFEAYGKDIMDSVRVNDWVSESILGRPAPHHVRYEMFLDKGGRKISKSLGNTVTSQRWLRYGTPESLLLLLYKRITGARELGFEDVPALMDEYGELQNIYFGRTKLGNRAKETRSRGLFEYVHLLEPPAEPVQHVSYRLLLELAGTFRQDRARLVAKKLAEYKVIGEPDGTVERLIALAGNYADDFGSAERISIEIDAPTRAALAELAGLLTSDVPADDLQNVIYRTAKSNGVQPREFFQALYKIILNTTRGPRLGPLILDIGARRVGEKIREHVENGP